MKKTIVALAALSVLSFSQATPVGVSHSGGSTTAGVSTSSVAAASSTGNGTAFTTTQGYQFASSSQTSGASTGRVGTQLGGKTTVTGSAETAGGAFSYTKTTGSGIAGSLTTGEACADATSAGAFLAVNGARGDAAGAATSRGSNFAGTVSAGNGEALRGVETSNLSFYAANADANKKGFTTQNLIVNTAATAQSDSTRSVVAPVTVGSATGLQNGTNFGNAVSFSNARVGNVCSGSGC